MAVNKAWQDARCRKCFKFLDLFYTEFKMLVPNWFGL